MTVAKIVGLAGILIELGGFYVLARELIRTNEDVVSFAQSMGSQKTAFKTMVGFSDGVTKVDGGVLGALGPSAKKLAEQVEAGKSATYWGLGLTGAGVICQFIGTAWG